MTDEERKMLYEIHDALLGVPAGSSKDEKPLLEDVRHVVKTFHRASWITRSLIWFIPASAAFAVAIDTLRGYFK